MVNTAVVEVFDARETQPQLGVKEKKGPLLVDGDAELDRLTEP